MLARTIILNMAWFECREEAAHGRLLRASVVRKDPEERRVLTGNDRQLGTISKCASLEGEWNASLLCVLSWKGFLKDLFCLALIGLLLRNANNKPEVESNSLVEITWVSTCMFFFFFLLVVFSFSRLFLSKVNYIGLTAYDCLGSWNIIWWYPTGHVSSSVFVCEKFSVSLV